MKPGGGGVEGRRRGGQTSKVRASGVWTAGVWWALSGLPFWGSQEALGCVSEDICALVEGLGDAPACLFKVGVRELV